MNKNNEIKKVKFFVSLRKEKLWLEQMATQGYLFKNITWGGVRYTFEVTEPKKMVYEIDRFNLPKNPTLEEIRHKEEFFAIAEELGWEEITHDVDMNYYFGKEYDEHGINELYNDEEMREIHAKKYRDRYTQATKEVSIIALIVGIACIAFSILKDTKSLTFALIYALFAIAFQFISSYFGNLYFNELSLPVEEWYRRQEDERNYKMTFRIFFTSRGLEKYFSRQSKEGWHIQKMTTFRFWFKKGEPEIQYYAIDSHSSVNMRLKKKHKKALHDGKDINLQNNDWQYQSVKDAENKGWHFLCATGNIAILYTRDKEPDEVTLLPTNRLCLHPVLMLYLACFAIGFLVGYLCSMFF